MFNNPLKKYQQGGQVSQEQQQMLAAFVEWLPKRVKEFQGMQPEQIVEALNGMSKSPEGQKQVQAYMQQFQKEMQNSKAGMFKDGGKLQDFICKHAKGGHVAGCDCNPIKGDNGIPGGMPATDYGYRVINRPNRPALEQLLDEDGSVAATRMINGADTTLTIPSKRGNMPMILSNNLRGANAPGKWMMRRMGEPGIMVEPRGTSKSWNADFDAAKVSVQTEEDGGKVNKAKDGEKLEDSAPERYYNERGVSSELNRYTTRPGRMLYAEVPTPKGNINFEFNQLNRAIPGGLNLPVEYDVQTRSMLDDSGSVGQQQLPLYQMPYFSRLKEQGAAYQEDGGVLKGQNSIPGGIPEPSTGEIRPDSTTNPIRRWIDRTIDNNSALRTASRYARNFGNSAMGKVLEFFMPNPENALASAPGFKFKMPYIPKYIREMYPNDRVGQIQSAYNHSIAKPIKMTDNFAVEYNRLTGHNGPLLDVLIEKNGGVVKGQSGIPGGMPYRYPVSRITDRPVWDEPHVNNPQVYQLPYSSDLRVTWPDVRSAGDEPLSLEHFEYIPGMTRIITEKPGQRDTTLISNGGRYYYSPYMKLYPDFNMSLTNIPSKKAWKKANAKIDAARDADLLNE